MMKRLLLFATVQMASVVCACGSAPPVASTPAVAQQAAPQTRPDPLDEKLRYCPLTVETAQAEVHDVDGGVELVVHVTGADQVAELEKRVHHLEEFTQKDGKVGGRHGTGKGGGRMQNCPVVTQRTRVEGEKIDLGFRIVVRSLDVADADTLRAETRRRLAALNPPAP
jgi:hypothetical protein